MKKEEPFLEEPHYVRSRRLLDLGTIADDMGFQCNCLPQCAELWTRKFMLMTRMHYLCLSKKEQLQKCYDLLLLFCDSDTKICHLQ